MMSLPTGSRRVTMLPRFVVGLATGLLLGILLAVSPVAAVVGVFLIGGTLVFHLMQQRDRNTTMVLAGTLVGAGIFMVYAVAVTVRSCADTADFCGEADVAPLAALAAVSLLAGVGAALVVRGRT
jgi:hypothetical protein